MDACAPVEKNILTHAHADHARRGSVTYYCSESSEPFVRERLGRVDLNRLAFGQTMTLGAARISLHPAGHILGSSQVRVEVDGEVWVVSGDYKREPDRSCEAFEVVDCDTFITEATFANPAYAWPPAQEEFARMDAWWEASHKAGVHALIEAYSLGKTQRILANLPHRHGPVLVHPSAVPHCMHYKQAGVGLLDFASLGDEAITALDESALVLLPSQSVRAGWLGKLGMLSRASASGWNHGRGTPGRRSRFDERFILSDHVDWAGLLRTVRESGARRVGVMHGESSALCEALRQEGIHAFAIHLGRHNKQQRAADAQQELSW